MSSGWSWTRQNTIEYSRDMERQQVSAKVPREVASEASRIAGELGTTRSQLLGWCIERGIADIAERMSKVAEAGLKLPPADPWKVGA